MEENFKFEIVSPEKIIFSNDIKMVTLPSYEGDMSILKNHISIITFLRPGIIKVHKNDGNSDILESLYANQQKWVKGSSIQEANKNLQKFLKSEGFSIDFDTCINNKEIEDFVLNDRIDGAKNFKVNATPTIIINNEKFEKTLNYKNLKKALEKLI